MEGHQSKQITDGDKVRCLGREESDTTDPGPCSKCGEGADAQRELDSRKEAGGFTLESESSRRTLLVNVD